MYGVVHHIAELVFRIDKMVARKEIAVVLEGQRAPAILEKHAEPGPRPGPDSQRVEAVAN